jgi:predicted DNA-binding protein with PD1-like motif
MEKKIVHATFSDNLGNVFRGHLTERTKIFSTEMFLIKFKNFKLYRKFESCRVKSFFILKKLYHNFKALRNS